MFMEIDHKQARSEDFGVSESGLVEKEREKKKKEGFPDLLGSLLPFVLLTNSKMQMMT